MRERTYRFTRSTHRVEIDMRGVTDEHIRDVLRRKQATMEEALAAAFRPRYPEPGIEIITNPFDIRGVNAKRIN